MREGGWGDVRIFDGKDSNKRNGDPIPQKPISYGLKHRLEQRITLKGWPLNMELSSKTSNIIAATIEVEEVALPEEC